MRLLQWMLLGLGPMLCVAQVNQELPPTSSMFEGVWEASTVEGPVLKGPLIITESGGTFSGEIGGLFAKCTRSDSKIACVFPGGLGEFKGNFLTDGDMEGHWIQPDAVMFGSCASPVLLKKGAAGVWIGEVRPLEDAVHMFLVVKRADNGTLSVYLRNPERNLGVFLQATDLAVDGTTVRVMGNYRGSKERVALATGSYEADDKVLNLYFPGRGVSLAFSKAEPDDASGFYARPKDARDYVYLPPTNRRDGWPVSTLQKEGLSDAKAKVFIQTLIDMPDDSVHSINVHAVLLARNGKLVLEEYFHGYSADRPHDLRSAAKSITSVLAGAALRESPSFTLNTRIADVMGKSISIDLSDPRKRQITVQDLLTMSSGLDCDDDNDSSPGNEDKMQSQTGDKDYYHFTLNLPMAFDPGTKAVYGSAQPNLLGGVIAADRNVWLPDYFQEKFAKPLGLKDYYLPIQSNGQAYMGGGVFLKPRDFLKLGQLMLNQGAWRGRRVLDRSYVKEASKPRYAMEGVHYGFLWWVIDYPYRGKTLEAFYAAGNGGQVVMVVPELNMVFECLGGNYSDRVMYAPQKEWFPKFILPMLERAGK